MPAEFSPFVFVLILAASCGLMLAVVLLGMQSQAPPPAGRRDED